ncbi:MAG: acyltransferase family protein [Lachnospiraceae bacterium]|nr:acyltransferase family protein [Lachnospiraceae bacterium]
MIQHEKDLTAYSRDNFQCLKGYLAICVLIHHAYQFVGFLSNTFLGYPLYLLGHLAVTLFMFMSGFGLFSSYLSKGESYIKSFPRNRLLPYYLSYLVFAVIYFINNILRGVTIPFTLVITTLTYGGTVVGFGWYLQLTLLMYVLFFVLKLLFRNDKAFIAALCVCVTVFIGIRFGMLTLKNNYEPAASFVIGAILAYFNAKRPVLFSKKASLSVVISLVSFLVLTAFSTRFLYKFYYDMEVNRPLDFTYLLLMLVCDFALICFVLSFTLLTNRYCRGVIANPLSKFFGIFSLEMYALQGLVFGFLDDKYDNRTLYVAVAVSCVIILSIPLHGLTSLIKKAVVKKTN